MGDLAEFRRIRALQIRLPHGLTATPITRQNLLAINELLAELFDPVTQLRRFLKGQVFLPPET